MDRPGALTWAFLSLCAIYILLGILPTSEESEAGKITTREIQQNLHNANTMRLKMLHRNAHDSPFSNPGETRLESLRTLLRQDKGRLASFSASIENAISASDHQAEAPEYQAMTDPDDNFGSVPRSLNAPIFSGAFVGSGQYFVDMEIGTPPHHMFLIADTGSDLVWTKCRYHTRGHLRNNHTRAFNADISSTFAPVSCAAEECQLVPPPPRAPCSVRHPTSCEYMYTYSDQSETSGIFAYETVTIHGFPGNPNRIPKMAIGCGTRSHGDSFKGADGVLGLGQGPISFPSQLGYTYSYAQKFSYCLVDHLNPRNSSSNFLVFGNRDVHHLNIHYTPFVKNPPLAPETYYYLTVSSISINRKRLPIPPSVWAVDSNGNGGTIIDSGTTLSYVLEPAYKLLLATFERLVHYPRIQLDPFDLCFNSSGIGHFRLPEFSIEFEGGALFQPPVDNYFIDAADDVKCLGILGSSGPYGFNVIGNIMQQNFFVEFDRRDSRLGFARTACSRLK